MNATFETETQSEHEYKDGSPSAARRRASEFAERVRLNQQKIGCNLLTKQKFTGRNIIINTLPEQVSTP